MDFLAQIYSVLVVALMLGTSGISANVVISDNSVNLPMWSTIVPPSSPTYKAAVCELEDLSIGMINSTARQIMQAHLNVFKKYAEQAKEQGVDIIVYPEYGVTGLVIVYKTVEEVQEYMQVIPDPKFGFWNPCTEPRQSNSTWILEYLSCLAHNNTMYLVANVGDRQNCNITEDPKCPSRGYYMFNTDVAFNRRGDLIARYHKTNLYKETPPFDFPPTNEHVHFDTEFGKFGILTCFDIVFYDPSIHLYRNESIRQFVYPTAWVETYPFFSSVLVQSSWAKGLGVTLLAANRHHPPTGSVGSGIYGPDGVLDYVYNPDSGNTMLIKDVPLTSTAERDSWRSDEQSTFLVSNNYSDVNNSLRITYVPLEIFNITQLVPDNTTIEGETTVCHNSLCCSSEYTLTQPLTDVTYLMGAYSGHFPVAGNNLYIEMCTILLCQKEYRDTCAKVPSNTNSSFSDILLSGNFTSGSYIYPSAMTTDMNLIPDDLYNIKKADSESSIILENLGKPIFSITLNARLYDRDLLI